MKDSELEAEVQAFIAAGFDGEMLVMAYPEICDTCRKGLHHQCERRSDPPEDPDVIGGWFCICSHTSERSFFEQLVWSRK